MSRDYVLNIMSRDRVGIIAGMTEAILGLGGNIGALSQTVMEGYFTVIVTVHFDADTDRDALTAAVRSKGTPGELEVTAKERVLHPGAVVPGGSDQFVLTIVGPDQKGIIHKITAFLSGRDINIEDLWATAGEGRFMLTAKLAVPAHCDIENLSLDIGSLWPEHDMRVTLQHENIFLATNNVDFRHHVE